MKDDFIDVEVNCNNLIKILVKEAKSYYFMKRYTATQSTCLVSIDIEHKDLIQLHKILFIFWFKDRSKISIASILNEIVIDCENTHDEVLFTYLENNTKNLYYRFNVSQSMQQIMLNEWIKKNDIKTYTNKYLRLNQIEQKLLDCVKCLLSCSQIISNTEKSQNSDERKHSSSQRLRITQDDFFFQDHNVMYDDFQFQNNFIDFKQFF